jgi:hypothetical protein
MLPYTIVVSLLAAVAVASPIAQPVREWEFEQQVNIATDC